MAKTKPKKDQKGKSSLSDSSRKKSSSRTRSSERGRSKTPNKSGDKKGKPSKSKDVTNKSQLSSAKSVSKDPKSKARGASTERTDKEKSSRSTASKKPGNPPPKAENIEELKDKVKRAHIAIIVIVVLQFIAATVGTVLIHLTAEGCYTSKSDCKRIVNTTYDTSCRQDPKGRIYQCRLAVSQTCEKLAPRENYPKEEPWLYSQDPDSYGANEVDQYHAGCVDVIARMEYHSVNPNPLEKPKDECIPLMNMSMALFYDKFWYSFIFSFCIVGMAIGGLVNAIFLIFLEVTATLFCAIINVLVALIPVIFMLIQIIEFDATFHGCYSLPSTYLGAMVAASLIILFAIVETIFVRCKELKELDVINFRRIRRKESVHKQVQNSMMGKKRFETESSDDESKTKKSKSNSEQKPKTAATQKTTKTGKRSKSKVGTSDNSNTPSEKTKSKLTSDRSPTPVKSKRNRSSSK